MAKAVEDAYLVHPIAEIRGIGFIHYQYASAPMPIERHEDTYELLYMETGEKRITVGDTEYLLRGGDLLVIHPGAPHGERNAVQNRSRLIYLFIERPRAGADFLGLEEHQRQMLTERLNGLGLVHTTQAMRGIVRQIGDTVFGEKHAASMLREPRLKALLLLLLDELAFSAGDADKQFPEDIRRTIDYIEQSPSEMPMVLDLARLVGLSENYFKKKFKHYLGIPPAEYVMRHHICLAQQMLKTTQLSATQIAMQLGFSSSQHFARQFKRYTGCAPIAYRKQNE